jgi:hypothetical protein
MLTLEGMGYGEIAEVLGISESNVGAGLTRAKDAARIAGGHETNADAELETWRRDWLAAARVPADLAARVARQSRRMKLAV